MAVSNWSDPSMAQQTGLTEPALISLINASTEAGEKMNTLRGQVDVAAGNIRAAMQSDAGLILQRRLEAWHGDFARIINSFVGAGSLTDRSQQMLAALRKANADSTSEAGRGQS